jgi:transposase
MPRHRGLSAFHRYQQKYKRRASKGKTGRAHAKQIHLLDESESIEEDDVEDSESSERSVHSASNEIGSCDQSSSESESEFVLPRHPQHTKATRVKNEEAKRANQEYQEQETKEKTEFFQEMHQLNVAKRQTAMLKEGVEFCVRMGILSAYVPSTATKLPAFMVCAVMILLNAEKHAGELAEIFNRPMLNHIEMLRLLLGTGKNFAERVVQLAKHVDISDTKTTVYAPTNSFYSRPGPVSGGASSLYTEDHLYVLFTMMNKQIRMSADRPANAFADQLRALQPEGEPISDLVGYLEGRVCFLTTDIRSKLLAVCICSPGPIDVNEQTVYRMIQAFPFCGLGEVYYGDRTKVKSTGVSSTASLEERRKQKIACAAQLKINEVYRSFQQRDYQPNPNFGADEHYRLPEQNCRLHVVFSDESWIAVGMRGDRIWLSRLGEQPEVGNDKGIRFVLICFADKHGIHTWKDEEYGKVRDFFVRENESSNSTSSKANTKKMKIAVQKARGEKLDTEALLADGQKHMNEEFKRSFGRGGCFSWQISQKDDNNEGVEDDGLGSYKSNVSSENLLNVMIFQLLGAKRPTLLVLDNAAYHKKTGGFSPFAANVRLRDCEEFLRQQSPVSDLGVFWSKNSEPRFDGKVRSKLKKPELIEELKLLMARPLSDLERKAAEIGIRQFGVPHRILFLPPRMPEWNPVEFIWAWAKHYYKSPSRAQVKRKGPSSRESECRIDTATDN